MKTMKLLGLWAVLAACAVGCGESGGGGGGGSDAGARADTGSDAGGGGGGVMANINTICARSRMQGCPTSANCETELNALLGGTPMQCRTLVEGYFACAAASQGSTCEMIGQGVFNGCQPMMGAIETCTGGSGADAGAAATLPSPDMVRYPGEDGEAVTWERSGETPQAGTDMRVGFGLAPFGAPANGHQFVVEGNFPTASHTATCTAGFLYENGRYTFSTNSVLTQTCQVRGLDESTSGTLTFTGGALSLAPAGNLVVTLNATLAGGLGTGPVTLRVVFPPRT